MGHNNLTRRVMQVEIMPDDDDPNVCVVWIRNPATGQVIATMSYEQTEEWMEGVK